MKNTFRNFTLALLFIFLVQNGFSENVPGEKGAKNHKNTKAELCVPASGSSELNINNVRARINTGGDMWWDFDVSRYEIPKGSRKTSMFSASLWIGGLDVNGQLKLAALRYRQIGNDYWPGPLTDDGTASVDAETCVKYDRHFAMTRSDVEEFIGWFNEPGEYPDYFVPASIKDWPAHGDPDQNQNYYLAPFFDNDGDGSYDPNMGDFPYYDFKNSLCGSQEPTMEGNGILVDQVLKGDQTLWWVFNDKGNAHTETEGEPIGLEIRAQAFAFATNDEINNMTFYSYEIVNRSTYTLTETYFSQWVDTDLGYAYDDFCGCDVGRGLGYCYNGKAIDGSGKFDQYGEQPPAIGVDFFQGPYMDPDGIDNPKKDANGEQIVDESINGVNFGDGIVDNERFGMRRFVYHNNTGSAAIWATTDPTYAFEYYRFLKGIWKDGTVMQYGGNAHLAAGATGPECAFMFPGDSDPWNWGTNEQPTQYEVGHTWTEEDAGNVPYDRRFMQSAGPFTLRPGAVNYITVGIPWARATAGGPFASVMLLRVVDDKCQALFDNCFKVLDGPDAPDVVIQELDRELIIYLSNRKSSNNYKEKYREYDPTIPALNADTVPASERFDSLYVFEGYQVFQLADATVSVSEIKDIDKARLVFQSDLKNYDKQGNPIGQLINHYFSEPLATNVPIEEVYGNNEGITHSFRLTDDAFAEGGDRRLVNHKQYYYLAIAYGYNQYMRYTQDAGAQVPGISGLNGQKQPYKAGRKSPIGQIKSVTAIPHIPSPESGGTIIVAEYGQGPKITRIEGQGNGGMILDLTETTMDQIMAGPPYKVEKLVYDNNRGPIDIKVVDPLNVKSGKYTLKFTDIVLKDFPNNTFAIDYSKWILIDENSDTIFSDTTIALKNEQLCISEGLGFSITIEQVQNPGDILSTNNNGFLEATIEYVDSSRMWLTGVPDIDGPSEFNWIRSGTTQEVTGEINPDDDHKIDADNFVDPNESWEKMINGTWAPYRLAAFQIDDGSGEGIPANCPAYDDIIGTPGISMINNKMSNLASVNIVFTNDKTKWTRCPVIETCPDNILSEGGADKHDLREAPSVNIDGDAGVSSSDNTLNSNYISSSGMGWFPGYAVNVETGERLNIIFGEDSWLAGENGRDMLFNPTANYTSFGTYLWGGKHYVYIMGHNTLSNNGTTINPQQDCPAYDAGEWIVDKLTDGVDVTKSWVFANAMYVGLPMARTDEEWLSNDVTIRIRVAKPYKRFLSALNEGVVSPENDDFPMYKFSTSDIATVINNLEAAKDALSLINVVPNPYYAYSDYEINQIDNRIKITNLPPTCTITIYSINGTMIRQFTKDNNISTDIDWDLKNTAGVPIAGGVYLIHVKADGVGERIIKWFGSLRPQDLNSF